MNDKIDTITRKPDLLIGGIPFELDFEQRLLRQFDKRQVSIPFDSLTDGGAYKVLQPGLLPAELKAELRQFYTDSPIIIPAQLLESRAQLNQHANYEFNAGCLRHGWGIYLVDELLGKRLGGVLPHIEIAGTDLTIDVRLKELRETALPWNALRFTDMFDTGENYLFYYRLDSHTCYHPNPQITALPAKVAMIELPNELLLDPVAVAREYSADLPLFLQQNPIQSALKATVKPLSESALPRIIDQNKKLKQASRQGKHRRRSRGL